MMDARFKKMLNDYEECKDLDIILNTFLLEIGDILVNTVLSAPENLEKHENKLNLFVSKLMALRDTLAVKGKLKLFNNPYEFNCNVCRTEVALFSKNSIENNYQVHDHIEQRLADYVENETSLKTAKKIRDDRNGFRFNFQISDVPSLNIASTSKMDILTPEQQPISNNIKKINQAKSPDIGTVVQPKKHVIVLSVLNPKSDNIVECLESRFEPHLKFIKIDAYNFSCTVCNCIVKGGLTEIKNHIISSKSPKIPYHFYCDICDTWYGREILWQNHLSASSHATRCSNAAKSRKENLKEYDCKTCKLAIFGDEISTKRHELSTMSHEASKRVRAKKKEIKLNESTKNLLKSQELIEKQCRKLATEANLVASSQDEVRICCSDLESALSISFKGCKVYPFGSRVSGLGNKNSDLDVFVDVDNCMYTGTKDQDSESQQKLVKQASKLFKRNSSFAYINPIPTARTPIVQVYHKPTNLDCDLSFRHGLSIENTKFLRLCIQIQPIMQEIILLLKEWLWFCQLTENVTTYALSMMVVFYLQTKNHLLSVANVRNLNKNSSFQIDGWDLIDYVTPVQVLIELIQPYKNSVKQLLTEFFAFYATFPYNTDIICPLMGMVVKKSLFEEKPNGELLPKEMVTYVEKLKNSSDPEYFRTSAAMCIQDPFDLSHNLTKASRPATLSKLKTLCDLTHKHLLKL